MKIFITSDFNGIFLRDDDKEKAAVKESAASGCVAVGIRALSLEDDDKEEAEVGESAACESCEANPLPTAKSWKNGCQLSPTRLMLESSPCSSTVAQSFSERMDQPYFLFRFSFDPSSTSSFVKHL